MTDRAGFLAAILSAPGDSLPKLVFADFLDECGEGSLTFAYRWCAARGKGPDLVDSGWWQW